MKSHPHFKTRNQARRFFIKEVIPHIKPKDATVDDVEEAFYEWVDDEGVIIDEDEDNVITGL